MEKCLIFVLAVFVISCVAPSGSGSAQAGTSGQAKIANDTLHPVLSSSTRMFISRLKELNYNPDSALLKRYSIRVREGKYFAGATIKTQNSSIAKKRFAENGVVVGSEIGEIWTVKIPLAAFRDIELWDEIESVSIDEKLRRK